jgi:NADH-quinone oxidoreductase subunit I
MSFERMYLLAIVKGMIITIKHLFTRKVTIQYPEQVRERSPVYRGQHQLKRDEQGRENCTVCIMCVINLQKITMTAEERKPEENTCTEKKNMLRYMKYVALYFFCLCEDAVQKTPILTTSKNWLFSYDREDFIYGKIN